MKRGDYVSKKVRFGLLLYTILTIAPVIIFIVYLNTSFLNNSKRLQINQLKNTARLIASEHTQIVEGARQLLITLSVSGQIKNPTSNCSNYLLDVLNKYERYSNIALTDSTGNVICSANNPESPVNVADRYFFKSILENKVFTIGEYSFSKITKEPIISFAYPIFNNNGMFTGILYSSLNLKWLNDLSQNLNLNENTALLILDRNGSVLSKSTNLDSEIGKTYPSEILIKNLNNKDGFVQINEEGKEPFFWAYQKIGLAEHNPYVVVGLPKSTVYRQSNTNFRINIIISLIITLLSVITGIFVGQLLIAHMVAATKKVDQLKRDFVSLVSHQLRTPLTAIKYFNEILLSGSLGNLKSKQKEFLQDSLDSTNRLISLVGTLLNISRLESGKIKFNLQKESLPKIIIKCQLGINHLLKRKKLRFIFRTRLLQRVLVDEKFISQVITNLLTNAIKYSNPKTAIEIKTVIKKGKVIVSVKNYGIVISQDEGANIFTKFFRAETARKVDQEGSGLGLYLSKLIIEMHGGRIWFTSSAQKGTTFFFALPF